MGHRPAICGSSLYDLIDCITGCRLRTVPRRVFDPPQDDIRIVIRTIGGARRLTLSKIPTSLAKNAREMGRPLGFAVRSWRSERNPAAVRVPENSRALWRLKGRGQLRTYLLNQSIVRCQARSAAALI